MKVVTKFKANDGILFDTADEAEKRDSLLEAMSVCDFALKKAVDPGCRFANGGGFIQHTKEGVDLFISMLGDLIEREHGKENADKFRKYPCGIVHRILDDSASPLSKLLYRVLCIDSQYREWGQPYFAITPQEGTQTEWKEVE